MKIMRVTSIKPPEEDVLAVHKIMKYDIVIYEYMYKVEIFFTRQGRWGHINREEFSDIKRFATIL